MEAAAHGIAWGTNTGGSAGGGATDPTLLLATPPFGGGFSPMARGRGCGFAAAFCAFAAAWSFASSVSATGSALLFGAAFDVGDEALAAGALLGVLALSLVSSRRIGDLSLSSAKVGVGIGLTLTSPGFVTFLLWIPMARMRPTYSSSTSISAFVSSRMPSLIPATRAASSSQSLSSVKARWSFACQSFISYFLRSKLRHTM
mmetsp:Transcript_41736/g.91008  ORF Transcript_41736/g.91008 Transcript_41736/m.91008 type:complete len:202 (+) Transcript_41736:1397-2002(+)